MLSHRAVDITPWGYLLTKDNRLLL